MEPELKPVTPSNRLDWLAEVVSLVLNPLVMPAIAISVLMVDLGSPSDELWTAIVILVLAFVILPLADILWLMRRGRTVSLDVPERKVRTEPIALTIGIGLIVVTFFAATELTGRMVITATLGAFIINLAVVLLINLFWKISVHMIGITGLLGILLYLAGLTGPDSVLLQAETVRPFLLLIPLVAWARVRLKAHTIAQVVGGTVLGFFGHVLALRVLL